MVLDRSLVIKMDINWETQLEEDTQKASEGVGECQIQQQANDKNNNTLIQEAAGRDSPGQSPNT